MNRIVLGILILLTSMDPTWAGTDEGRTSAFSLGAGARDLSLAGANRAVCDAATSPYWNPSRLASVPQLSVTGFHTRLFESDVAYDYLGLALPTLGLGGFGVGIIWQNTKNIERRDGANLLVGTFDDSQFGLYLAYGRSLSGYNLGIATTIAHHSMGEYRATTSPGFNLSVGRQLDLRPQWLDSLAFSISARNLVRQKVRLDISEYSYPAGFDASVSFGVIPSNRWQQQTLLSASISKSESSDAATAFGIEHSVSNKIFLRAGRSSTQRSIGAGIALGSLRFDYALVDRDLGSLHTFSISAGIGKTIAQKEKVRSEKREREFSDRMNRQIASRNLGMIDSLIAVGKDRQSVGDVTEASSSFDRALFIARSTGMDTAEVHRLATDARDQLETFTARVRYDGYVDSATAKLADKNYLAASYFAELALSVFPGSEEALRLKKESDAAAEEVFARAELIDVQLLRADSLISMGQLKEARTLLQALEEYASERSVVEQLLVRLNIEHWRELANAAHTAGDHRTALAALDSVLKILPRCAWCKTLKEQIEKQQVGTRASTAGMPTSSPVALSRELRREVEELYKQAQQAFEAGELKEAIAKWEIVESRAPDYLGVRKYLVAAYKFAGIDLYAQKLRQEALDIWGKAKKLDPQNSEIDDYINRATSELAKLREFSHEQ